MYQLSYHWTDFPDIWYWRLLLVCQKIHIYLKLDKSIEDLSMLHITMVVHLIVTLLPATHAQKCLYISTFVQYHTEHTVTVPWQYIVIFTVFTVTHIAPK